MYVTEYARFYLLLYLPFFSPTLLSSPHLLSPYTLSTFFLQFVFLFATRAILSYKADTTAGKEGEVGEGAWEDGKVGIYVGRYVGRWVCVQQ